MENSSNIQPDQIIVVEGDAGFVPKAEPSDAGKVLGVVNASGDVGWVEASGGQLTQQQADWAETDPSKVTYIDNKPDLSVYATSSAVDTALASKQDVISDLSDIRAGATAGATAVQPSALDSYATTSAMNTALAGKQDTISDLSTIRAGATAGSTAVQPAALNDYATTSAMNTALASKQDVINDLSDIRAGAAKGDTAVQPAALDSYATTSAMNTALAGKQDVISDLSDIRAGAAKGDTAVQPAALEDYATTSAMNTALADKQDVISDLSDIRAGAALGATAAQPSDLPSSDELVPSATSGDSGKVLTVDSNGEPIWQNPAGGSDVVTANGNFKLGGSVPVKVNYTGSQEYERGSLQLVNTFADGTYAVAVFEVVGAHSIDFDTYGSATVTINEAMDIAGSGNSDFMLAFLDSDSNWVMTKYLYRASATITDGKIIAQSLWFGSDSPYITGPYIGVGVKVTNNPNESEKVAAVVQQLANGAVSISNWPSEQILATTIPAKTSELTNDSNFVVSSSLATVATTGAYSDLTGTPTIPSVDQSYNASSSNAQSGTAVAQAIATIPSSSYTAGDGIDITSNEISVDYDTNTLDVVGQTITENVTQQSTSGLFLLPSSVAALLSQQDDTQVTVHIPANTLKDENFLLDDSQPITFRLTLYATDSPSETSVSLFSTPVEYTGFDGDNAEFTEQDIVFNLPASVANQWSQNLSSAVAFNICGQKPIMPAPATSATLTVIGDLTTSPITFTFVDASATKLTVKNPVPASTSADEDKVLTVNSSGTPVWATAQGGGGTVDQTYNASSTNAQSGTAVAGALATVNQVPASTSSDEDKVLTVNSSGNPVWAAAAAPYSKPLVAGSNITITDGANDVTIAATNTVPASTSADEDKVLTVNSSGEPVWAAAQGGGGSGGDSEFPYDPGYMHTGWNKMVVRFGDTTYDPTNKTSASSFTSIVALNEPGVYEYTFNVNTSHEQRLFTNEWNDFANNPVDILQLTGNTSNLGGYYSQLFLECSGLRSVWNMRGIFGVIEYWFYGCTNLQVVSGHINERYNDLSVVSPYVYPDVILVVADSMEGAFQGCTSLKKINLILHSNTNGTLYMSQMCRECTRLEVGPGFFGPNRGMDYAFYQCGLMHKLYGESDFNHLGAVNDLYLNPVQANTEFSMMETFNGCVSFSDFNGVSFTLLGSVWNLDHAFAGCRSLTKIPDMTLSATSGCDISSMCYENYSLLEVPRMSYGLVNDAGSAFEDCRNLLDVSRLTELSTACTDVEALLHNCWSVKSGCLEVYTALSASGSAVTDHSGAFTNAGIAGGNNQLSQIPSSWGGTGA